MVVLNPFLISYKLVCGIYSVILRIFNLITFKQSLTHIIWELILYLTRKSKPRIRDYPIAENGNLEDNRIRIPAAQRDLEHRRSIKQDESDTVLIYGCYAQKQRLLVRVSVCNQLSLATLFLRLNNGKSYSLPKTRVTNLPRTNLDCFVGNGLRIRCVVPLRKWRISYSGLLEETSESGEKKLVNVKLGLFWSCSSKPHDLQTDIPNSDLAEFFASQKGLQPWKPKVYFVQNLDSYVQAGNMIGSVSVEGTEERLALWGAKKRSVERDIERPDNHTEVIVYTRDGQMFHFGSIQMFPYPKKLKYGFVVLRSSMCCRLKKVQMIHNKDDRVKESILSTGEYDFRINFGKQLDEQEWPIPDLQATNRKVNVTFNAVVLQDDIGEALILQNNRRNAGTSSLPVPNASLMPLSSTYHWNKPGNEVVTLSDLASHYTTVTGGKGSSLASLSSIRKQIQPTYDVPNAIVVSTLAYDMFSKANQIQSLVKSLEKVAWNPDSTNEDIEDICEKVSSTIGFLVLPQTIQTEIENKLAKVCGQNYRGKRFAVRSSASGEDSEEMSAAGQMKTFLGLIGLKRISEAVVQCWASQFSFTAVQYKKQNGQELNTPMAVVIQEMVAADTAGVLFTRDPVTGNADRITMSCNYGIGESVVSASADPDTIVFQRDTEDNLELKSVFVGGKNSMTIMSDENGVRDSFVDEERKKKCSVSVKNAQTLAEIAVKIEEAYGCPVDLEWAIKNDQIYILQARPITTLDKESELEIMHEIDYALRSEEEYLTRANTGEVVAKPMSYLGTTTLLPMTAQMFGTYYRSVSDWVFLVQEFAPVTVPVFTNLVFINMPLFPLRFHKKGVRSLSTEASMISGFGKILDDQDMLDQADRRNKYYPKISNFKLILLNLKNLILCKGKLLNSRKLIKGKNKFNLSRCKNSYEMYIKSMMEFYDNKQPAINHIDATILSGLVNSVVLTVLVTAVGGKWSNIIYNDFATILSHCMEVVESATVPTAIEELSRAIAKAIDVNEFKRMTKKSALGWLKSTKSDAGVKYHEFIKSHGHRGINEFDVYRKMWEMDEIPLIETLQSMAGSNMQEKTNTQLNTSVTIKALSVPLSFMSKLYLRVLIPICRRQVACREISKSLYVYRINQFRRACWETAEKMVLEGRLPDKELFFFLTNFEIFELLETRNPKLIQKAFRRRAFFPKFEELEYDLITKGYPTPINRKEEDDGPIEASFTLTGTPVSQGNVKALARVAVNLDEARLIQKGEILVARGTDIGWSPYFPMVSGVVTELGGLVSHGAVVAREYGLPCVVGVEGATRKIKSGDLILLDANKGTVTKIKM